MLKCLVVDDEELARALLESYIQKLEFLELVAKVEGPVEAMQIMKKESIDIIFLDIQMPDLKGTDFAKMLDSKTQVIFTTAYSEYALEGFELNALDYLLKPITFERFLIAVNKAKSTSTLLASKPAITVKSGYDLHKLMLEDIQYIESDSEYVIFHTNGKKVMSHQSLRSLEKSLPNSMFMRVHRSFIVNKSMVAALKGKDLLISDAKIPVSARYMELVKQELFG